MKMKKKNVCPMPGMCPFDLKQFTDLIKDGSFRDTINRLAGALGVADKPVEFPKETPPSAEAMDLNDPMLQASYGSPLPGRVSGVTRSGWVRCEPDWSCPATPQFPRETPRPKFETIPYLYWWRMAFSWIGVRGMVRLTDLVQGQGGRTLADTNNPYASMLTNEKSGVLKTLEVRILQRPPAWLERFFHFHKRSLWWIWTRLPCLLLIHLDAKMEDENLVRDRQRRMMEIARSLFLRVVVADKVYYEAPAVGFHQLDLKVPGGTSYAIELQVSGNSLLPLGEWYMDIEVRAKWDLTRPLR